MKCVVITSIQPGEGKTTAVINLAAGLLNAGLKAVVVDLGRDSTACSWIMKTPELSGRLPGYAGTAAPVHLLESAQQTEKPGIEVIDLDYGDARASDIISRADINLLIVGADAGRTDYEDMTALDGRLYSVRGQGLDLIIPFQYDAREWESNDRFLTALGEALGWDRIANPVPS